MVQVQAYMTCEWAVQVHGNNTPETIDQFEQNFCLCKPSDDIGRVSFDLL